MHLEEFAAGVSVAHRLDPRIKLVVAIAFSFVVALSRTWPVLVTGLVLAAILVAMAQLPLSKVIRRLAVVNTFILLLWVFLPFSQPGRELFRLGPLTASYEGVWYALAITVKSNAIILSVMALLATSTVFTLVHALRHLYLPDKLVNMFFFTFRYFQVIHQEYLRLRAAMRIRCFRPRTNRHTYRSVAYLMGMLLVRSFDRSDRVRQAMLCRGYNGQFWVLDHFHLHGIDYRFALTMGFLIILMAVGEWICL